MVERLETTQAICDRRTGRPYKLVKRDGNHRAEVWRLPNGTVKLEVISTFAAAQEAVKGIAVPRPHPAAKRIMQLHKNDLIAWGADRRIMRVVKMSGTSLTLAPHQEGGSLKKRDKDKRDPFRYTSASATRLKDECAQKVRVSPSGRVMNGSLRLG